MQETKIVPPQPWHTVARQNSCRDYKYFCRFIPVFLERKAAVMIPGFRRTILCHYQNLSKIHYEVKRWKNGNCRSESKCNCTYFLPHKICISPRLAKLLQYSLSLRICNGYGTTRHTNNSKL